MVTFGSLCPRICWTSYSDRPPDTSIDANPWRRSWMRILISAFLHSRYHCIVTATKGFPLTGEGNRYSEVPCVFSCSSTQSAESFKGMERVRLDLDRIASTFHTLLSTLMFFQVAVMASLARAPVDSKNIRI